MQKYHQGFCLMLQLYGVFYTTIGQLWQVKVDLKTPLHFVSKIEESNKMYCLSKLKSYFILFQLGHKKKSLIYSIASFSLPKPQISNMVDYDFALFIFILLMFLISTTSLPHLKSTAKTIKLLSTIFGIFKLFFSSATR